MRIISPIHRQPMKVQLRNCKIIFSGARSYVPTLNFIGAGPMQAPGLFDIADKKGKFGMVHNIGLGGAAVVSLLRRPEFFREGGVDGRNRSVFQCGLLLCS